MHGLPDDLSVTADAFSLTYATPAIKEARPKRAKVLPDQGTTRLRTQLLSVSMLARAANENATCWNPVVDCGRGRDFAAAVVSRER